jgi:hypothetical protein
MVNENSSLLHSLLDPLSKIKDFLKQNEEERKEIDYSSWLIRVMDGKWETTHRTTDICTSCIFN